jgi:hypothetical protein
MGSRHLPPASRTLRGNCQAHGTLIMRLRATARDLSRHCGSEWQAFRLPLPQAVGWPAPDNLMLRF